MDWSRDLFGALGCGADFFVDGVFAVFKFSLIYQDLKRCRDVCSLFIGFVESGNVSRRCDFCGCGRGFYDVQIVFK